MLSKGSSSPHARLALAVGFSVGQSQAAELLERAAQRGGRICALAADLELEKQSVTVRESWKGWSQKMPESALPEIAQPEHPSLLATTVTCFGQPAGNAWHPLDLQGMLHVSWHGPDRGFAHGYLWPAPFQQCST